MEYLTLNLIPSWDIFTDGEVLIKNQVTEWVNSLHRNINQKLNDNLAFRIVDPFVCQGHSQVLA